MFLQKFKVGLRFLGVLFLRALLGIVVGCLWMFAVAFTFHTAVGSPPVSPPVGSGRLSVFDIFDHFYELPTREFRIGVLWGFLQGRLDLRKWLRRKYA